MCPKGRGVVEVDQVAQLVDDYVVAHVGREKEHAVRKIEVPPFRAAAPAAFVIFDKNFPQRHFVQRIKMRQPRVH
jgi:hypothetical protein